MRDVNTHVAQLLALQQKFPDVVVAGRSAALVHDLPVWKFPPAPELIRHPDRGRPGGVRLLRTCAVEIEVDVLDGLRVTTMERTASDVALSWPTPTALVTVDAVLRRGVSRSVITKTLQARGPIRGVRRARATLGLATERSESPLESYSRGELVGHGIPRPWVNPWLRLPAGWVRVDNYWPELGIVGEADGSVKYRDAEPQASPTAPVLWAEKLRQEAIENVGLLVVRWTADEITRRSVEVVARFERLARRRDSAPWRPPPSLEVARDSPPIG